MPKIQISVQAHVSLGDTDPVYEATAMQSDDEGNTWMPVHHDDDTERPIEAVAGDRDAARARMATALGNKFGGDGWELDDPGQQETTNGNN